MGAVQLELTEKELVAIGASSPATPATAASAAGELVALGANSHALLRRHIAGALEAGLRANQIEAALRTAEYVQERAAEMTADTAAQALGGDTPPTGKEHDMTRKWIDCRDFPDDTHCTLYLSGAEADVVRAAAEHAASVHGKEDTPELREMLQSMLQDETTTPAHA